MIEQFEAQVDAGLKHLRKHRKETPKELFEKEFRFLKAAKLIFFQRNKALLALKELGEHDIVDKIRQYELKILEETENEVHS